jgi:N,N'-diacetyllegionaminate synthase
VDAVKFQTFIGENLISKYAEKADYQKKQTGNEESQLEMIKKLELTYDEFRKLKRYCEEQDIDFLSTPFDIGSIDFLEELGINLWKIPSGEVTNTPYLIKIAKTGKAIIMSTGMSTLEDIEYAMNLLRSNGAGEIALLHCNTAYPTPYKDVNLRVIPELMNRFACKVGYSDHTKGIEVPIAAVALGASIIEKHFTIDKKFPGPDHNASINPKELGDMVKGIRIVEEALGSKEKHITKSEIDNIVAARKSIVAKINIKEGEIFTENNITTKRPGSGINPVRWQEILGLKATRDYEEDDLIEVE